MGAENKEPVQTLPMHVVTFSPEVQAHADPQVPVNPPATETKYARWQLVSACWQVTRSQLQPSIVQGVEAIVSYGRWVWTWERRRES